MPFVLPEEKPRELPPTGVHAAICIKIIDLGTQETKFGKKHQLYIQWELPDERAGDDKPFALGKFYNYSSDPKATLRTDIQGWLGRTLTAADFGKFDLGTLLGTTCTLGVAHATKDDHVRAHIASVLRPPKGVLPRLSPSNLATVLSLSDRPFDYFSYEALPDWLKEIIAKSPEFKKATNSSVGVQARTAAIIATAPEPEPVSGGDLDDAIPF